jgi:DNA-binding Xre family transcriptional regulator
MLRNLEAALAALATAHPERHDDVVKAGGELQAAFAARMAAREAALAAGPAEAASNAAADKVAQALIEYSRKIELALGKEFAEKVDPGPDLRLVLANNLRIQRAVVGLNRTELAEKAGISFKQLSLIESGVGNATMLTLQALARALGCPAHELLIPRPRRR